MKKRGSKYSPVLLPAAHSSDQEQYRQVKKVPPLESLERSHLDGESQEPQAAQIGCSQTSPQILWCSRPPFQRRISVPPNYILGTYRSDCNQLSLSKPGYDRSQ